MEEWEDDGTPKRKKKRKKKRRHRRKYWYVPILVVLGILIGGSIFFFAYFYVQETEIVGNTRYTDDEIEQMTMSSFLRHNSLFLAYYEKSLDLEDVAFMDSIDIEYLDHNSVRLHVNEDNPIGYIEQSGLYYYFNVDGVVLESVVAETAEAADGTESVIASSSEEEASDPLVADTVTEGESLSDTEYTPALTDVPMVEGLTEETVAVGDTIQVSDESIFQTLLALTRMMSKFEINADIVSLDSDYNITLYYDDTVVMLGPDTLMEEKMTKVAAILPQILGQAGTLHLENYTEDTINIIFDPLEYEQQKAEEEAAAESSESSESTSSGETSTQDTTGTDTSGEDTDTSDTDGEDTDDGTNSTMTDEDNTTTYTTDIWD